MNRQMPKQRLKGITGFTLIEVLVVLLIISIVTSVAMLSISHNQNQRVKLLANELTEFITLAEEQAILQQTSIGLVIAHNAFQFVHYQTQAQGTVPDWQPLMEPVFKRHLIPSGVGIRLEVTGKTKSLSQQLSNAVPQIVISSGGEVTPFVLWLGNKGHAARYKIVGAANGHIEQSEITP